MDGVTLYCHSSSCANKQPISNSVAYPEPDLQLRSQMPESTLLQDGPDLELGPRSPQVDPPIEAIMPPGEDAVAEGIAAIPTTTANQASKVSEEQPPVAGTDSDRTPTRELAPPRADRESSTLLTDLKSISVSLTTIAILLIVALCYLRNAAEPISKNPSLIVAFSFASASMVSGIVVVFFVAFVQFFCTSRGKLSLSWPKYVLLFSVMSLAIAAVALISSMPKTHYYMLLVFVPPLTVVGIMSFYDAHAKKDAHCDDPQNTDEERSFQLAVTITSFSIMGGVCCLIGYQKNFMNRAHHNYMEVAICFMFSACLTGFVNLLSRKDWKKTAVASAIMLCLLVSSLLMVATTFLGGAVAAAAALPLVVAAACWFAMEYRRLRCNGGIDNDLNEDEQHELKPMYTLSQSTMPTSFSIVMTIFSGFLGGVAKGKNLEVCIFFAVSCFVSSLILGLFTFRAPRKASLGATAKALYYFTLLLFGLTAVALVPYVLS